MNDVIPYEDLMPRTIGDKMSLAGQLAKSGLLPRGLETPAKVMAVLQMSHELGIAPMVGCNNISVINGKPTLGSDLMIGLAKGRADYRGMETDQVNGERCRVVIRRAFGDVIEESVGEFSMDDAKRAGLLGKSGPWQQYPDIMLYHRAVAIAVRKAYPDVLAGIYTPEEMRDVSTSKTEVFAGVSSHDEASDQGVGVVASIDNSSDNEPEPVDEQAIEEHYKALMRWADERKDQMDERAYKTISKVKERAMKEYDPVAYIKNYKSRVIERWEETHPEPTIEEVESELVDDDDEQQGDYLTEAEGSSTTAQKEIF